MGPKHVRSLGADRVLSPPLNSPVLYIEGCSRVFKRHPDTHTNERCASSVKSAAVSSRPCGPHVFWEFGGAHDARTHAHTGTPKNCVSAGAVGEVLIIKLGPLADVRIPQVAGIHQGSNAEAIATIMYFLRGLLLPFSGQQVLNVRSLSRSPLQNIWRGNRDNEHLFNLLV